MKKNITAIALALLGDDRAIAATYAAGRQVHVRETT